MGRSTQQLMLADVATPGRAGAMPGRGGAGGLRGQGTGPRAGPRPLLVQMADPRYGRVQSSGSRDSGTQGFMV